MKTAKAKSPKHASASALIIAVILTSLLAIIGMMFVMIARVDKMATSSIALNKDLDSAVETVVANISQQLILDVPGMPGQEYYDYPGEEDKWLASVEPNQIDPNKYYWRHISDIYDKFGTIESGLRAEIIPEYITVIGDSNSINGYPADADGDGVADSNWVMVPNITSNKGKPIYAAVRIVDNGAMLNVNTADKFDPTAAISTLIDGSSQMQINLMALAGRDDTHIAPGEKENRLWSLRCGSEPFDLSAYKQNVVWRYDDPVGTYTPFDISDELKLRNRYILNYNLMTSRIEGLWTWCYDEGAEMPRTDRETFVKDSEDGRDYWFSRTYYRDYADPCYDYRHISTIYNMDRTIKPNGEPMVNVNGVGELSYLADVNKAVHDSGIASVAAAQIAVNIKDYVDSDSNVASFTDANGITYYGFEQPCIYISELAQRFVPRPPPIPEPPTTIDDEYYTSYAIELYKPYAGDDDPCKWQLKIGGVANPISIDNWNGKEQYYVILKENSDALFEAGDIEAGTTTQSETFGFSGGTLIELQRFVPDDSSYVTVDSIAVPVGWFNYNGDSRGIQRDITLHKCIRRLWADAAGVSDPTLGRQNTYFSSDANLIQAHPANSDFNNIGEVGIIFQKGAYYSNIADKDERIGYGTNKTESDVRLNLADPDFQKLFSYLTVFDPNSDTIDNDGDGTADNGELKVPGRININTAPWFVLAQLPWVSQRDGGSYNDANLARAIVAYRDKVDLTSSGGPDYTNRSGATGVAGIREDNGFESIGELNFVIAGPDNYRINYYDQHDPFNPLNDLAGFPDLTPGGSVGDGVPDDFEERDVIFARISNLVTVRSDVFTAYILVRIGPDGPQKRVMAILDRSNVRYPNDKVRIIAIHPVPDPR